MKRTTAGRLLVCLLIATVVVAAAAGCSTRSQPSQKPKEESKAAAPGEKVAFPLKKIQIVGATSGGTYFAIANGLSTILMSKIPGLTCSAQSSAGTPQMLDIVCRGEAEFCIGQSGVAYDAFNGIGRFEGRKLDNFRSVSYFYPNVMHLIVHKDIKSLQDLKGKRVSVGAAGSATEVNSYDLFCRVLGMDYRDRKDMIPEYTSGSQAVDLLRNRQVVAHNGIAGLGAATVIDPISTGEFKILAIPKEVVDKLHEIHPSYERYVIPGGYYPNHPDPIETFAVANWMYCRADLPEEAVYTIVKTIYENIDEVRKVHAAIKDLKLEDALYAMTVPLHPGAEKYYREKGLIK